MFRKAISSARAYFTAKAWMIEKRLKRLRKTLGVAVRHQQSSYTVLHDIWNSAVRPANHRLGAGHGLQKHYAKTFSAAG